MLSHRFACLSAVGVLAAATLISPDADACGGCFHAPTESTVVTGHRMAVSISPQQSVLWDQIQYAGDTADFSWVLPVKEGARIEVASDAFFDVLEAATQVSVQAPPEGCAQPQFNDSGVGCTSAIEDASLDGGTGGFASPNSGVQVIHEGSVGPYETVTLSATDPGALTRWLDENGYALPADMVPTVDAYVAEGFDFIALKLAPGQGVQQMQPVRVVSPGSSVALPLRMVAAGAGANVDLVLYIIGEGRYEAKDFENAVVPPSLVTWDFRGDTSDYAEQRLAALEANDGRTWLTTYSRTGPLLSPVEATIGNNFGGGTINYQVGNGAFASTITEAYYHQGEFLDEVDQSQLMECLSQLSGLGASMNVVVENCDAEGENCNTPAPGQIGADQLRCGNMDDIATAMLGLHPADVVLSRLEARIPREQLSTDLILEASEDQKTVPHQFVAGLKTNACWDSEPAAAPTFLNPGHDPKIPPGMILSVVLGAAGLVLVGRRRKAQAL